MTASQLTSQASLFKLNYILLIASIFVAKTFSKKKQCKRYSKCKLIQRNSSIYRYPINIFNGHILELIQICSNKEPELIQQLRHLDFGCRREKHIEIRIALHKSAIQLAHASRLTADSQSIFQLKLFMTKDCIENARRLQCMSKLSCHVSILKRIHVPFVT